MHEGWYNAANKALSFLDEYIASKNITGRVKVWIAGFSRGGATTNLAAGLLDNKFDENNEMAFSNGATLTHDDLYAYTFEAPQGANYNSVNVRKPGDPIYNNIFNVVNPNDLVPKVAMSEYGFTRFGTDKFICTKFFDPENYASNRETFKALYAENGCSVSDYNADDFKMYGTPLKKVGSLVAELVTMLPVGVADIVYQIKTGKNPVLEKDDTKANYDANIAAYLLLEEMTENIGSRENYCNKYQSGVSTFLLALKDDVNALSKEALESLITKIVFCKVGSALTRTNDLSRAAIKAALPADVDADKVADAINPLLDVVGKVYWERPNELISVGMYISNIFQNHENSVNIAHLEAQDNYYVDAYNTKNGTGLALTGLLDSADFGRISFKDYNDIGLFNSSGNTCYVSVKGAKAVKSEVKKCSDGFAVGYYSYATEDGLELFMPVNQKFILNMKGFSIKPYHTVNYHVYYQSVSSNSSHVLKDERANFDDWFCGNTDFKQIGVNMNF